MTFNVFYPNFVFKDMRHKLIPLIFSLLLVATSSHAKPLDFTLNDLNNNKVSLSDYRGQWVVVNFWASWCGPCIREMPHLIAFQNANPNVQVLGINFEETSIEESRLFLKRFDMNFPNLKIGSIPLVPLEPLKALPSTFFINPKGELAYTHIGPVSLKLLQSKIR